MSDSCVIWQGDSTELAWLVKGPITAIVTDPPYGMAHESGRAVTADQKRFAQAIENDSDFETAQDIFWRAVGPLTYQCAKDAEMYVFCRWDMIERWKGAIEELSGWKVVQCIVWDKVIHGMGDLEGTWANCHEMILHAKRGRRPVNYRSPNVISVQRVLAKEMIHPTEKPVELLEKLILVSTNPGDFVVDPFCGSGSTIVACHRRGRLGLGIEMDTENGYVEQARARLNQMVLL